MELLTRTSHRRLSQWGTEPVVDSILDILTANVVSDFIMVFL